MSLDPDVRQLLHDDQWRFLTAVPEKFAYYSVESYFRESWRLAVEIFESEVYRALQRIAVLAVKPDGVITRAAPECLEFLGQHGFRPVVARPVHYERTTCREMWRFQWNAATLDRIHVADAIHACAPGLLLFFVGDAPVGGPALPATVRLVDLKGPADPAGRRPDQLRSRLAAVNRMVVAVHASDEPLDIVRELGVLFPQEALAELYMDLRRALAPGVRAADRSAVETAVRKMHERTPAGHRTVADALQAFDRALAEHRPCSSAEALAAKKAGDTLHHARLGSILPWDEWSRDLRTARLPVDPWTSALIATQFIQHDITGVAGIIHESGRERWLRGEGRLIDD